MKVLKFGGSSLATPDIVRGACDIVARARGQGDVVVVVSAFGGVTDALMETMRAAVAREDDSSRRLLETLEVRHREAVTALASEGDRGALLDRVGALFRDLHELVHGVAMLREASPRTLDRALSAGERLSAAIVAAALRKAGVDAEDCDARALIVTGPEFGQARVLEAPTRERIRAHFGSARPLQVVTGFIAATPNEETTTLGRGGSDYTASILGAALDAESVELWTDVDGVLSADPRVVPEARPTGRLTYEELMELSHFGAKVVHPPSVHPIRSRSIPLRIRNTFRPAGEGTLVTAERDPAAARAGGPVIGIASIPEMALLRLEGDGMVGVPGIAMRLFGALARQGINVVMISQASSEHSICFVIGRDGTEAATRSVAEEFAAERSAGLIGELVIESDVSIVAAVGAGMRERAGIAGKLFGILGRRGVNVRAVAQGSSELNISLVVAAQDEAATVRAIHRAFFRGQERAAVALAGVGRVGRCLLAQVAAGKGALRLVGVADSRGALLDSDGLDPSVAAAALKAADPAASGEDMVNLLLSDAAPARVLVDCTAGDEVPAWYDRALHEGACVVTANKRRLAGPGTDYASLARAVGSGRLFHETTVGAALPVLGPLADLVSTGDRVRRIEGLLSGTLAFVTSRLAEGASFADAVREAHQKGYTEPDPREDLAGRDAGRKLLILARLAGWTMEPEDVDVESLIPDESLAAAPLDEFWERLGELDAGIARRRDAARAAGKKLVYLACVEDGRARVALSEVGPEHPCHSVSGTDNLLAFTTERYAESPLVIRGPGAGPDLTASGVLADVLRAVRVQGGGS